MSRPVDLSLIRALAAVGPDEIAERALIEMSRLQREAQAPRKEAA